MSLDKVKKKKLECCLKDGLEGNIQSDFFGGNFG